MFQVTEEMLTSWFLYSSYKCNTRYTVNAVTIECLQYLAEPCVNDLSVLNKYITAKRLFRRLIPAVPSSAPVERRVCKGALITTPRHNRLGDKHFQKLLLLNANKQ